MGTAIRFAIAASSALVIGAGPGARWDVPRAVTGVLLAFASGALVRTGIAALTAAVERRAARPRRGVARRGAAVRDAGEVVAGDPPAGDLRSAACRARSPAILGPVHRLVVGVVAAVATMMTAAPAAAQTAEYNQQIVSWCCYMTLEPGDTAEQVMRFRNTGTKTWFRAGEVPVKLGTSNPFDRTSPFFNQPDWLAPHRPTALDQASVAPGQIGTFTWVTKAPPQPGSYREHYAPVAEGVTWMAPTATHFLNYTVLPAKAPAVAIASSPPVVQRGAPIVVAAEATDNRAVDRVTFSAGTQTISVAAPTHGTSGYSAALSSAELGAGVHNVLVRAYDVGGREASAVAAVQVYEAPPPAVVVPPPTRLAPFRPLFVTRAGRGQRLGTFNGVGDVVGARRGATLRIVCVRGCTRRLKVVRRVPRRGSLKIRLRPGLRLRASTRLELQLSAPGFVTRYQRYRFRRRPEGTRAAKVAAGCLSRRVPRRTTRCPPR